MFADNEAPRVRSQIKQCGPVPQYALQVSQRLTPVRPPFSCHSKLFLEALPALRVSGRLRQEDNKVRKGRALAPRHGGRRARQAAAPPRRLSRALYLHQQVKATLYLKHRLALHLHTNLNAKIELHARTALDGGKLSEVEKRVDGRVELSQKLLNLTGPPVFFASCRQLMRTCCRLQTARTAACVWASICARKACMPKPVRTTFRSSLLGTGRGSFHTPCCMTSKRCAKRAGGLAVLLGTLETQGRKEAHAWNV